MTASISRNDEGSGCAQTSNEDLLKSCLEHYDRVSTIACEWNNQVPQAIRAWYAAKSSPSAAKPIERCASGEPCSNTETGWCWGRCMKEYAPQSEKEPRETIRFTDGSRVVDGVMQPPQFDEPERSDKYGELLRHIELGALLEHGLTSDEMGTLREALRLASSSQPMVYECSHPNCGCDPEGIESPPCRAEHATDIAAQSLQSADRRSVPKTDSFSDNAEPDAWLEVDEPSEEIIGATLVKPDGGEPGVRYLPLYTAPQSATRASETVLDVAEGILGGDENPTAARIVAKELLRLHRPEQGDKS